MKHAGTLVGIAALVVCGSARAADRDDSATAAFVVGTVLMSAVTPMGIAGAIMAAEPAHGSLGRTNDLGIGLLLGSGALLAVGLPLFLGGEKRVGLPPPVARPVVGIGAGRLDLRMAF